MNYKCEVENIEKHLVACMRTRCDVKDIPAILGEGYGKIFMYLSSLGMRPSGAPYAAYFNMDMHDLDMEFGFPVESAFEQNEHVILGEMPEGKYAATIFTGPYSDIEPAYKALAEWMNEQGHVPVGAAYEFYLNDPEETPPEKLMTKILFPLK